MQLDCKYKKHQINIFKKMRCTCREPPCTSTYFCSSEWIVTLRLNVLSFLFNTCTFIEDFTKIKFLYFIFRYRRISFLHLKTFAYTGICLFGFEVRLKLTSVKEIYNFFIIILKSFISCNFLFICRLIMKPST